MGIQESEIIEVILLIYISAIWGQHPVFWFLTYSPTPSSSAITMESGGLDGGGGGEGVTSAGSQVLFSL